MSGDFEVPQRVQAAVDVLDARLDGLIDVARQAVNDFPDSPLAMHVGPLAAVLNKKVAPAETASLLALAAHRLARQ